MTPLCIYHGNCADGFGAAWVFKRYADREHGGKWDAGSKAWVFHPDQRAAVEAALAESFGESEE